MRWKFIVNSELANFSIDLLPTLASEHYYYTSDIFIKRGSYFRKIQLIKFLGLCKIIWDFENK